MLSLLNILRLQNLRRRIWGPEATTTLLLLSLLLELSSVYAQEAPKKEHGKDPGGKIAVAIEGLRSDDYKIRDRAIKLLVAEGKTAMPPLLLALKSAESVNARWISVTITSIVRDVPDSISLIAKAIDDEKDPSVRRRFVSATESLSREHGRVLMPSFIKCLKSQDDWLVIKTAEVLVRYRRDAQGAVPVLIDLLKNGESLRVKKELLVSLGKIGRIAVKALPVIKTYLRSGSLRAEAILAISGVESGSGESLALFVKALEDKDERIQKSGLKAIERLGPKGKGAAPAVQKLLKSDSVYIRASAIFTLRFIVGRDPAFVKVFLEMLNDENSDVKLYAVTALGKLGPLAKTAVPKLIEVLNQNTKYGSVEAEAAYALSLIGEKTLSVPALRKALKSPKRRIQQAAKSALRKLGAKLTSKTLDPRLKTLNGNAKKSLFARGKALEGIVKQGKVLVPALLDALDGFHDSVRSSAVEALCEIGKMDPSAIPEIAKGLESKEKAIRLWTLRVLGNLGESAKSVIPSVQKALKDPVEKVRISAVSVLGSMGEKGAMILLGLLRDRKSRLRSRAVEALGVTRAKPELVVPALGEAVDDADESVRFAALQALGAKKNKASVAILLRALKNSGDEHRGVTANSLGRIGKLAAPALPRLLELLEKERDQSVERSLVHAIGRIGPGQKEVVIALVNRFKSTQSKVTLEIVSTLKTMDPDPAIVLPIYIQTLHQKDGYSRKTATSAIAALGEKAKSAVPELIKVLSDKDFWVVSAALEALAAIGPSAKAAIPEIEKLVGHSKTIIQRHANFALKRIGKK